jgi:DNA-binding response OmpR family regulator
MKRILVIEDDPAIVRGLEAALRAEHYDVLHAPDGEKGLLMARRENIDLVILDVMLPGIDGKEVCRRLREAGVVLPILMLTSRNEEMDKVLGLELGADDYMTKPFSIRELLARIKALLRRQGTLKTSIETYAFGEVEVDFVKLEARAAGTALKFSATEFHVLKYFVEHEGEVVSREQFLNEVWGYESYPTTRTVDNYILSLRKKIEPDPAKPRHLLTVHTVGYKFVREGAAT